MEENLNDQPPPSGESSFDVPSFPAQSGITLLADAQSYLITAGKWARFLGVMGFIFTALLIIIILFMGTFLSVLSNLSPMGKAGLPMGGVIFFYLVIAIFYFFMSLYLYQFGNKVTDGVNFGSAALVTEGLEKLKSLFKLLGITTIVFIVLYILIIVGTILFASHAFRPATPFY